MVNKYLEKLAEISKEASNPAKIADRIMSGKWGRGSKVFSHRLKSNPTMWYERNFDNLVDSVASLDNLPRHLTGPDIRKRGVTLESVGKEMANLYNDKVGPRGSPPWFIPKGKNANNNLQWMADRLRGKSRKRIPKRP